MWHSFFKNISNWGGEEDWLLFEFEPLGSKNYLFFSFASSHSAFGFQPLSFPVPCFFLLLSSCLFCRNSWDSKKAFNFNVRPSSFCLIGSVSSFLPSLSSSLPSFTSLSSPFSVFFSPFFAPLSSSLPSLLFHSLHISLLCFPAFISPFFVSLSSSLSSSASHLRNVFKTSNIHTLQSGNPRENGGKIQYFQHSNSFSAETELPIGSNVQGKQKHGETSWLAIAFIIHIHLLRNARKQEKERCSQP